MDAAAISITAYPSLWSMLLSRPGPISVALEESMVSLTLFHTARRIVVRSGQQFDSHRLWVKLEYQKRKYLD